MERLTRRNPNGKGYRIPMEFAGSFRIESQGGVCVAFGDLVDKLGKLEDQEEARAKKIASLLRKEKPRNRGGYIKDLHRVYHPAA